MDSEYHTDKSDLIPPTKELQQHGRESRISKRYLLSILGFFGFFNVYALRVNMSVALVAMVNDTGLTNESVSDECPAISNTTTAHHEGEFRWNLDLQGLVLGSFFYGYIVTQIPGGWLSEIFGGHRLFGLGVLTTSVFTLLTPVAARYNVYLLVATRVIEGLGEAVTFPAMHSLIARWSPPKERSRFLAFTYSGVQAGTLISLPISGLLCKYGFDGGWPSVFYVFGTIGIVWYIFWWYFIYGSPETHPTISLEEKEYIVASIGETKKRSEIRVPWLSIATSRPFWALLVVHFCNNWGFYTLLTEIPNYLKTVLRFNISQDGFLSALPYLVAWVWMNVSGIGADMIIKRQWMSTTNVRKIANTLGMFLPAVCLLGVALAGCDHAAAVALLAMAVGTGGFVFAGFAVNHVELAPQFAGTLLGITNCVATIPGFLSPQIVGYLTQNDLNHQKHQWQVVFYIAAAIYTLGAVVFAVFGTSERQPWADGTDDAATFRKTPPPVINDVINDGGSSVINATSGNGRRIIPAVAAR